MTTRIDITGKWYGRLTAKCIDPNRSRHWICVCSCGKTKSIAYSALYSGLTRSCGCLAQENREAIAQKLSHDRQLARISSGQYIGVFKRGKKFFAHIDLWFGPFDSPGQAAMERDEKAKQYLGKSVTLNFTPDPREDDENPWGFE